MDTSDLASLLTSQDDEPTVQARAAALATALRGQQQQAQQRQFLGSLGQLTGSEGLAGVGNDFSKSAAQQYADAQKALEQLPQIGETRLKRAIDKQRADQQAAFQTRELDLRQKQQQEEAAFHRAQLQRQKFGVVQPGGTTYNTETGEMGNTSPVPKAPAGGAGGLKESDWTHLAGMINPSSGRSGELGKNAQRVNTALRLEQLAKGANGDVANLTPQQMEELAVGLQGLIAGGGHSTAEVAAMKPESYVGHFQDFLQKLTNTPHGANQQAFTKNILDTIEREKGAAGQAIRTGQISILKGFPNYRQANKERFDAMVRGYGIDPESLSESATATSGAPIKMKFPDGSVHDVPPEKVELAKRKGGVPQ